MTFSHGALSQMLAEAATINKNAAAKIMLAIRFIDIPQI
jgi:hypothetical protein